MAGEEQTLSVRFEADVADLRAALADVTKRVRGYEQAAEGSAGHYFMCFITKVLTLNHLYVQAIQ